MSNLDNLRLFETIKNRNISELKELLDRGINVNIFSEDKDDSSNPEELDGSTPLKEASKQGWIDGVRLLIEAGADVHLRHFMYGASTALGIAVVLGNLELVELLLQANAHPNFGGDFSPLHQAVLMERDDIVRTLLEAGAILNAQAPDTTMTPLMVAASTGNLDITKFLVEAGARINDYIDENGNTPLVYAADRGHQEVFDYLLPFTPEDQHAEARELLRSGLIRKQRRENKSLNRLIEAIHSNSLEAVQEAIKGVVDINAFDERGETALHKATFPGKKEAIIYALIEAGADPNIKAEDNGDTPLMKAAGYGDASIVNALIKSGANPNQAVDYFTPLMRAAELNRLEVAKLLVYAGADVNYQSPKGENALYFAYQNRHIKMAQLLLDLGATNDHCPVALESDWF